MERMQFIDELFNKKDYRTCLKEKGLCSSYDEPLYQKEQNPLVVSIDSNSFKNGMNTAVIRMRCCSKNAEELIYLVSAKVNGKHSYFYSIVYSEEKDTLYIEVDPKRMVDAVRLIMNKFGNKEFRTIPEESKILTREVCNFSRFSFLKRGMFVRIQTPPYAGDVGQVFLSTPKYGIVVVRVVPRINKNKEDQMLSKAEARPKRELLQEDVIISNGFTIKQEVCPFAKDYVMKKFGGLYFYDRMQYIKFNVSELSIYGEISESERKDFLGKPFPEPFKGDKEDFIGKSDFEVQTCDQKMQTSKKISGDHMFSLFPVMNRIQSIKIANDFVNAYANQESEQESMKASVEVQTDQSKLILRPGDIILDTAKDRPYFCMNIEYSKNYNQEVIIKALDIKSSKLATIPADAKMFSKEVKKFKTRQFKPIGEGTVKYYKGDKVIIEPSNELCTVINGIGEYLVIKHENDSISSIEFTKCHKNLPGYKNGTNDILYQEILIQNQERMIPRKNETRVIISAETNGRLILEGGGYVMMEDHQKKWWFKTEKDYNLTLKKV